MQPTGYKGTGRHVKAEPAPTSGGKEGKATRAAAQTVGQSLHNEQKLA